MKSKKNLLEQLKLMPYFSKGIARQLGEQFGLKNVTVDTYISRFLKYKEIIKLKGGLYVSVDFFDKHKADISYSFYLANIVRAPSYVSSWAALQYYNLATEVIHPITSVTLRVTRRFHTKIGNFTYRSIRKDLFSDFSLVKGEFDFFIASPSKALFDLLYFRTSQFRSIKLEEVNTLIEELRIDIDEMDEGEQKNFYLMIKKLYE